MADRNRDKLPAQPKSIGREGPTKHGAKLSALVDTFDDRMTAVEQRMARVLARLGVEDSS